MADRERNVVLTGFMGTGKSTVGRLLAIRLGYTFVDTDDLIEQRHGPIPEIFRDAGEETFRCHERDVAAELATRSGLVIATGGRLMVDTVNAKVLGDTAEVFCLHAPVEVIVERLVGDTTHPGRPLLKVADVTDRVAELLAMRAPAYEAFTQIDTADRQPDEVATDIANRLWMG